MADERDKNLDGLTVAELRERASELEITGRSSMAKDELRTAVEDAEIQTASMQADSSSSTEASDSASADSGSDDSGSDDSASADSGNIDISNITAPSIGPNTTIDLKPPEERLDHDKISNVDAMGLDKRRQVQGQRYGASPLKQLVVYGVFLVVVAALFMGGKMLADELDKSPETVALEAPWAESDAKQVPPVDNIDLPRATDQ